MPPKLANGTKLKMQVYMEFTANESFAISEDVWNKPLGRGNEDFTKDEKSVETITSVILCHGL
uniref:Uncharacterized protein n=1 Tax=Nelumbo nucifera TaxID=4432 RepID=A0A822XK98_NELNU|nr:TPA_asm: hypothetical protein HUJ06_021024 [Nelumbo nucifera]